MGSHRAPGLAAGDSSSFFDTLLSLHLTWQKSCVIILVSLNWAVSYVRADLSHWASEREAHVYRVLSSPPQTMLPVQPSPLAVHPLK